jgi:hypothetical protein
MLMRFLTVNSIVSIVVLRLLSSKQGQVRYIVSASIALY